MNDRERLEAAIAHTLPKQLINQWPVSAHWVAVGMVAAAERLAQLPEKCERCDGAGLIDFERDEYGEQIGPQEPFCPTCHGIGTVYPPALVERIKIAIGETFIEKMGWGESKPFAALEAYAMAEYQALAVLDAINDTETP